MDPFDSKPMPPLGDYVAAGPRAILSRRGRPYKDHDFVNTTRRPLDYDEFGPASPTSGRKRHNSQDGHYLVFHGSNNGSRKRNADADDSNLHSSKKPRKHNDSRNDRLCLQCGNYHTSPCYVPYCSNCGEHHYPGISCLGALEQLKKRLEQHAPPETPLSSKQKNKNMVPSSLLLRPRNEDHIPPSLLDLRTPTTLFGSVSQSPVNKQEKDSPNKGNCPMCRECGNFHRSRCTWLVCAKCPVRHHPEILCAVAKARLEKRLEEEDAKQAQKRMGVISPPRNLNTSVSGPPSMSQQEYGKMHPSRHALFLKPTSPVAPPLADLPPTENVAQVPNEMPHIVTYGASLEQNVDAFIAEAAQGMYDSAPNAPEHVNDPQDSLSYFEYLGGSDAQ